MSIVKKKKHVSKKNKKDWRKHCDIRDVEEFLEDQRLEERLGKYEEKADSELFVIDLEGDGTPEVQKDEEKPLSAKLRRRAKLKELPKCFDILLPSSKVQDPNAKRNHVNPVGTKVTALSKITDKRRFNKGVFQKKVESARRNRKIALDKKRKSKQIRQTFDIDLWGDGSPAAKGIPETLCDDFISPEAQIHNVLTDKRLRPKPPLANSVTTRAAIEKPHPGTSYNPSFQEYQELLQDVVKHEEKMIKKEKHLERVTTNMFKKVTQEQKEKQWQEEMGIPPNKSKTKEDPQESDNEYKAINPPVQNKKKDHKTRRKQKERLLEKERIKQEKIDKKKITDLYKLRQIKSSIIKKETTDKVDRERRTSKRLERAATQPPALGATAVPLAEPDLIAPEELTADLAHIKPRVNLLRERYESLQRRGVLAGAKLMMKKKRKLKAYFKSGHKVTEKDIERYIDGPIRKREKKTRRGGKRMKKAN